VLNDVQKISFAIPKMGDHDLVWWESHVDSLTHENLSPIFSWDEFKKLLKEQFYPLGHHNKQLMKWQFFRQQRGQ